MELGLLWNRDFLKFLLFFWRLRWGFRVWFSMDRIAIVVFWAFDVNLSLKCKIRACWDLGVRQELNL